MKTILVNELKSDDFVSTYLRVIESIKVVNDHVFILHCSASIFDCIHAVLRRLLKLRQLRCMRRGRWKRNFI